METAKNVRGRFRRWRGCGVFLTVSVLVLGVALGAAYYWFKVTILDDLPSDLSTYREYRPQQVVVVHDRDGTQVDEFHLERRYWVSLDELPPWVPEAFVASEDRKFYSHPGVDLAGVMRAAMANFSDGSVSQGGSTLTQQLVKNLITGNERSYERKLREAVLAYRLDQELGKGPILELYLNFVALGAGNYGVEAAARDYFGISARDLDPGQAALLAGLPPAPSRYSPRRNPEVARARRDVVLQSMVSEGYLDADDAAQYRDDPLVLHREPPPVGTSDAAYVTEVRRETRRVFTGTEAFDRGLVITSALDTRVQAIAVASLRTAIEDHAKRQGPRVPTRSLSPEAAERFIAAASGLVRTDDGQILPADPGTCLEVVVGPKRLDDLRAGPHRYKLRPVDRARLIFDPDGETMPRPVGRVVQPNDVLDVCVDGEVARLSDRPWAEGAAVVLDHRTGEVIAMVGGYETTLEGFNRASQARRQPGSSFKPYVYATALANGRNQLDTMFDGPISLPAGNGKRWSPKNYGGSYAGSVTMRSALTRSLNTIAVRLALDVGPAEIASTAYKAGVRTKLRTDVTMALGSSEVTPLDQAVGYATIARNGNRPDPVFIRFIGTAEDAEIGVAGSSVDLGHGPRRLPGGPGTQTLDPGVSYEVADMMRSVVKSGTARRAYVAGKDRAGKTGTTNGFVDAWFVGFTPRYVVSIWIGTDGVGSLGRSETGGRAALPAWQRIVEALDEPDGERREPPAQVMLVPSGGEWVAIGRGRASMLVPRKR